MKAFAALYQQLDQTTKTSVKVRAMADYFAAAAPLDAAWAVYFLTGRKLQRVANTRLLRAWAAAAAEIPEWLFDECYDAVGDLAETMALVVSTSATGVDEPLHVWADRVAHLAKELESERRTQLMSAWSRLDRGERFVFNKLITGAFRVGVSQRLVVQALARAAQLDARIIAHRLMGDWGPTPDFFSRLIDRQTDDADVSRPYPFCLAHPLQVEPATLGPPADWLVEWKWDGIRAQVLRRQGRAFLWSRGEEQLFERFPELHPAIHALPDGTVLDGELVAWRDGQIQPFSLLQRRIGRKQMSRRTLREAPVRFLAFDLLEQDGLDVRNVPLRTRAARLRQLVPDYSTTASVAAAPLLQADEWSAYANWREESRGRGVEGLMLKRADSEYAVGRRTGVWWKWKIAPLTCDAVLVYAQRGHGRRAGLYTDYTFAAWHDAALVPFAKAYSGLTDDEIRRVDRFVRQNTLARFGPVRTVRPQLVFELAFENIQESKRHKAGIAVRFPRIVRWREDKQPHEADTLESIKALIRA